MKQPKEENKKNILRYLNVIGLLALINPSYILKHKKQYKAKDTFF